MTRLVRPTSILALLFTFVLLVSSNSNAAIITQNGSNYTGDALTMTAVWTTYTDKPTDNSQDWSTVSGSGAVNLRLTIDGMQEGDILGFFANWAGPSAVQDSTLGIHNVSPYPDPTLLAIVFSENSVNMAGTGANNTNPENSFDIGLQITQTGSNSGSVTIADIAFTSTTLDSATLLSYLTSETNAESTGGGSIANFIWAARIQTTAGIEGSSKVGYEDPTGGTSGVIPEPTGIAVWAILACTGLGGVVTRRRRKLASSKK